MQLRTQIFLLTAAVVLAILVLTAVMVQQQVDSAMATDAETDLKATVTAIEELADERRRRRVAQLRLLRQLASDDLDRFTARLRTLYSNLDQVDLFAVLDERGRPVAATGPGEARFLATRPSPQDVPLLAEALSSPRPNATHGVWRLGNQLYEVAAMPVGQPPSGAVLLATGIDDEVIKKLCRVTGSKVVILADAESVASCLPDRSATRTVVDRFPELQDADGSDELGTTPSRRILVGGMPYLARRVSVGVDFGGTRCHHVVLRSLAEPLALAESIERRILGIGLVALLLAFACAWFGARRIAGPLRRLAHGMSRIARSGRLEPPPEDPKSSQEVALFQDAFHRMMDSIQESQKDRESSYIEAVEAVMAAIDHRDRESAGHSHRVGRYAVLLAEHYGLSGDELKAVEWGALLHDVGKIAVPDAILRKDGPLDENEWRVMRRHPEWGHAILEDVRFLHPALDVVRHHHERWDGKGYPQGLRDEQIPLAARIFSVVDTYDAITSDRYYRAAQSHEDAVEELQRVAGTQLDPRIVQAFMELPETTLREIRLQTHRVSNVLEETRQLAWEISVGRM